MEDDEEVYEFDLAELGRIAAQAVKQVMNQKLREAERDKLYDEFESRVGQLINGTVQRFDGEDLVILSRTGDANVRQPKAPHRDAHDTNLITFHRVRNFRALVY